MMRILAACVGAFLWLVAGLARAQSPADLPVEAFGSLPVIADVAISPDGAKVALATSVNGMPVITVIDIDQNRTLFQARVGEAELRNIGFIDDRYVSYLITHTFRPGQVLPAGIYFRGAPRRIMYSRNGVVDLQTSDSRLLTQSREEQWQDFGSRLFAPIEGDAGAGRLFGRVYGSNWGRAALFRVTFDDGRATQVNVPGTNNDTIQFVIDERGAFIGRIDSDRSSNRWRLFVYDNNQPRLLREGVSETGEPIDIAGLLPDGRLVTSEYDDAYDRLYAIDRATGQQNVLAEQSGYDITTSLSDPWTHRVVGAAWTEDESLQRYFEPDLQAAYERAIAAFGEHFAIQLLTWSRDRSRFVVYADNGFDGGGYYLFKLADGSIARLGMRYPAIADAQFGSRQAITYPARDGVRIPAYLTTPEGESRNLPLVLLVHGGPHGGRDTMAFDWMASFLASRGYAVIQPNYRGSGGYGRDWERAGYLEWGGLMQTDVEDAVAALIRARIADPARVCIVGASYGGYAALAGATLTPERYACAASIGGVSDLLQMITMTNAQSGATSMASDYWRRSIGDRDEDRDHIRSVSPANLADRVSAPILLIHGVDDVVVPILQSERMDDRLRDAGKDVRFVRLEGDDHWLSDASTRIQTLRELETFLAAHLTPN